MRIAIFKHVVGWGRENRVAVFYIDWLQRECALKPWYVPGASKAVAPSIILVNLLPTTRSREIQIENLN